MKSIISAAILAYAVKNVAAHATFQQLWVDGVDQGTSCARIPLSNSPVQDVTSKDLVCNAGTSAVSSKCDVTAGSTVTVEMHQQPNDRSCSNEAIGGAHYGPVLVYMSAVSDASTADGSDGWFKVFEDTWSSAGSSGSDDNWGTKDLNTCCGKMDVKIPTDLAPGDYLPRAEAIALHAAGSSGGAQFYVTCYQVTVSGSGTATVTDTVLFPGAYAAEDAGILINIYQAMTTYEAPGPAVYSGGSTKTAGAACAACESTCTAGATGAAATTLASATSTAAAAATTTAAVTSAATTSAQATSTAQATTSSTVSSQVQAVTSSSSVVSSASAAAPL
ncbi:glycosyl hydrolase family 61-domain-containing protein [Truncatella angustata]|uniref:lytic cellulose monooxygenase (C4-dehydrogenating) n=1 Tax=Truncatella angustata TaxID=152316 RepID=A0A9P8UTA6_9PEZI|nr:glycosyl hydrolase family 61-domain-containing protein [Truncatella angustata]KAH6657958.1 glycosyl hydrolase family 61-domain-containing protein [Truncatella angustata]